MNIILITCIDMNMREKRRENTITLKGVKLFDLIVYLVILN